MDPPLPPLANGSASGGLEVDADRGGSNVDGGEIGGCFCF
jgi:hypothetical protein